MSIYYKLLLFLLFFIQSPVIANWKTERESLEQYYIKGDFRLFYTLKGENSIKDRTDKNNNNIPDIVENTAIQLLLANEILQNSFGLMNPLKNNRYNGKVQYIDVHFLNMKYSGNSGDGIIQYNYKHLKTKPSYSLSIGLSNHLKTGGLTPAHELFHTYQNGYTYFKNRWYTEGTARWFEFAFHENTGEIRRLPDTISKLNNLLNSTYDAKYFWNRITQLCNKKGTFFKLSKSAQTMTYIGEDKPIITKQDIYGYRFIKRLLENFEKDDEKAYKIRNLKSWKEIEQRSYKNNNTLLKSLQKTIQELKCKHYEIEKFNSVVSEFIELNDEKIRNSKNTQHIKILGLPLKEYYHKKKDIYARNPWSLKLYNEKIYIGAGNTYNIGPAANAGPVPIYALNLKTQKFIKEGIVDDEQISAFIPIQNKLFIPGADAIQDHSYGNIYFQNDNEWIKLRTIPNAYHIFSLNFYENKLFAAISTSKGAQVAWSQDGGRSWATQALGRYQSTYNLLKLEDRLYAIKTFLPQRKIDTLVGYEKQNYHAIAEFHNGIFVPKKEIQATDIFPDSSLNLKRHMRIIKLISDNKKALIIGGYGKKQPFGLFLLKSLEGVIKSEKIIIDPRIIPIDLKIYKNKFLVLGYIKKGKAYTNIVTEITPTKKTKEILSFDYPSFARSFEIASGSFYFGIGSEVKNVKKWKAKELHKSTGEILKINKKHLNF